MPGLGEIIGAAAKIATEKVLKEKGTGIIGKAITTTAAIEATTFSDKLLEKIGIQKKAEDGTYVIVPAKIHIESKIKKTLALHPERKKLCFHINSFKTIKDGIQFMDPEGNKIYHIPANNKNYKKLNLYKDGYLVGSISEKLLLIKNPLSDPNKYEITNGNASLGNITVKEEKMVRTVAIPDFEKWKLVGKWASGDYTARNEQDQEIGKVYLLGDQYYVMDYTEEINPTFMILAFMTIKMRSEKDHITTRSHKGL